MKRILLAITLLLSFTVANAAPVGVEEARTLGRQFAYAHFDASRQSDELSLVYSQPSFYVFNVGNTGFVILSSDDCYRPLIGYSQQGTFNPDDMAPALQDYLDGITASRAKRSIAQDPAVAAEWQQLRRNGRVNEPYRGKDDTYLVETQWNQNYPYNYMCPAASDGPGGHVYAGCVATAGAQLMRFWNSPIQGTGSHTYTPEDHPEYGPLTANFGETTYDWEHMPASISSSSPIEQIEAVAQLIYHVGVSVDMNYRPGSSGATTSRLCTVMPQYFYYTPQMQNIKRENHTHESYMALIVEAIDMGWPMVHRGNGHAYVLDGYNAEGLVHFNWGWSGSQDGWFDIDGHNYAEGESVIYNYVPDAVYSATSAAPTNLVVTPDENNALSVTLSWVNPTVTLTNQPLSAIDQIVVMRGNKIVYTADNVTPGGSMSCVDNEVPCYDVYSYKVFAVVNGQRGRSITTNAYIGPACSWKFVVSSANMLGWRGAYISVRNGAGHELSRVVTNGSTAQSLDVDVPLGRIQLVWVPTEDELTNFNITINVKDHDNNSVYSYSGLMGEMTEGVIYEGNNGCGNAAPSGLTGELTATDENGVVILNWPSVGKELIGYNVYRDGMLCALVSENEFVDADASLGGHCYQVCVLGDGGESDFSNEVCGTAGENCGGDDHLWFEIQPNGKPIISWEIPEVEGLSGFYVYRKVNDDGTYEQIKMLGANKKEYKETRTMTEGNWYFYRVVAAYLDIDCESAPFKALYGNEYFVKIYYSLTDVDEASESTLHVYPNPANDQLSIEGDGMLSVAVYDLLGQLMLEQQCPSGTSCVTLPVANLTPGMYLIKINNGNGVTSRSFIKK